VGYYGVREIAAYRNDPEKTSEIFSGIFRINLITTIIVTTGYIASVWYIPELKQHSKIFIFSGVTLYLAPISIDWYFQGLENFKMITFRSLIIKCLTFAGLFIFVRQREDIIPYILLSASATIVTNIWNLGYARKTGLKIRWRHVRSGVHVKPMLVFFVSSVMISIYILLDTLMLGFLSSYEQVGFYTSPVKVFAFIMSGIVAINAALIPRLSFNSREQNHDANNTLLQKTFDINSLLIIPIAIGGYLIAPRFVPVFFGYEFTGSVVPMQILSFRTIAVIINVFLSQNILMAFGLENKLLLTVILTAVLSLLVNLMLIPRYGAVGASVTSLIAEYFEVILQIFMLFRFTQIRTNIKALFTSALCTLPFFVLSYLCNRTVENNITFLIMFISSCTLLYLILQRYCVKHYLIVQLMDSIIIKIKHI
jgi:O-antigen/teichoic acid export membrane protein